MGILSRAGEVNIRRQQHTANHHAINMRLFNIIACSAALAALCATSLCSAKTVDAIPSNKRHLLSAGDHSEDDPAMGEAEPAPEDAPAEEQPMSGEMEMPVPEEEGTMEGAGEESAKKDIVELVKESELLSTLLAGIAAADKDEMKEKIQDKLKEKGPFTVFAPSNDAFMEFMQLRNLSPKDVLALPNLKDVLKLHVVSGKFTAEDIVAKAGDEKELQVPTLQGEEVKVKITDDGDVMVGDAMVVTPDVDAKNGVVHIIDAVLMPEDSA